MFESVTTTEFLGRAMGLYFIAAGIGLLFSPSVYERVMEEVRESATFRFLAGVMAFAFGAVVLGVHNDWSGWPANFITLLGWVSLIKGLAILAIPKPFTVAASALFSSRAMLRVSALIVMALGVLMMWVGGATDSFADTYLVLSR